MKLTITIPDSSNCNDPGQWCDHLILERGNHFCRIFDEQLWVHQYNPAFPRVKKCPACLESAQPDEPGKEKP